MFNIQTYIPFKADFYKSNFYPFIERKCCFNFQNPAEANR